MTDQLKVKLVRSSDYLNELVDKISKAKKRVALHAMLVAWSPRIDDVAFALQEALKRHVEVRIVSDYYSKFYANMPKLPSNQKPRWAYTSATNYRLEALGAHITYLGKIGLNPFKGRTHSKIVVVDDCVYTFGGINFNYEAFDYADYMLRIQDKGLADRLYELLQQIAGDKLTENIKELISPQDTLLYDYGIPGSSIIYETSCQIVKTAKKVYYASMMCPSGELANYLNKTENYCYFSRAGQVDAPDNIAHLIDRARYHINNRYKGTKQIHAKFILTEQHDGSKQLVTGSNNFSWRGVAYGTKEIALFSTDPQLWSTLFSYLQEIIA